MIFLVISGYYAENNDPILLSIIKQQYHPVYKGGIAVTFITSHRVTNPCNHLQFEETLR